MLAVDATLPLAFLAGLVSFLSPCVFPLIPAYAAFLSGQAGEEGFSRRRLFINGIAFVIGFSLVFVVLFYVLAAIEVSFFISNRGVVNLVAGLIVIILALQTMGLLHFTWFMRDVRVHRRFDTGLLGAGLLGITFAAGWSPCLGPVLGAILQVAANYRSFSGLPLLLIYCAGLAIPFLLVALLADRLQQFIRAVNHRMNIVNLVAGALLLAFGILLATGKITDLSQFSPNSPFNI